MNNIPMYQKIAISMVLTFACTTVFAGPPPKAKAEIVLCSDPSEVVGFAELREQQSDQGVKLVPHALNNREN